MLKPRVVERAMFVVLVHLFIATATVLKLKRVRFENMFITQ